MKRTNDNNEISKKDGIVILATIITAMCLWVFIYSAWDSAGRLIAKSNMTLIVLLIAMLMCVVINSFTSFKIKDMGLSFRKSKKYILLDLLFAFLMVGFMSVGKMIFIKTISAEYFAEKPFFDFSIFARLPILYYPLNAFLQEFSSKGFLQESLNKIFGEKHGVMSVLLSSLICCSFHIHMGFRFMIYAFIGLTALGFVYQKQRNIWGLLILHYSVGISATMLGWVG